MKTKHTPEKEEGIYTPAMDAADANMFLVHEKKTPLSPVPAWLDRSVNAAQWIVGFILGVVVLGAIMQVLWSCFMLGWRFMEWLFT